MNGFRFSAPPGWPVPPMGWEPPEGWTPDPTWPPAPAGWSFWVPVDVPVPLHATPGTALLEPALAVASTASNPDVTLTATDVTSVSAASGVPSLPTEHPKAPDLRSPATDTRIQDLESQVEMLRRQLEEANNRPQRPQPDISDGDFIELNDARLLQQVGIYEYHHPLENAELYREQLASIRDRIKECVRLGKAIEASDKFAYNNSLAMGRKMTADLSKLMLRAYNAEADNCVRSLRAGAIAAAKKRLGSSADSIARLGRMMEMRVAKEYQALRIEELELTADYLFKQQEERERAREERERLREERKAEQELQQQREKLNKERAHYLNALDVLRSQGDDSEVEDIANRLREIDAAIEMNDFRTANIRAGYVYIISNIGAFGESMVKIGMTRRLEPLDRVRELGDASVPFPFDVHALYFSEDAVTLEAELHNAFGAQRVNHVNLRREFFFATPEQVRDVLVSKIGNLLDFASTPEAEQYFQSLSSWPPGVREARAISSNPP